MLERQNGVCRVLIDGVSQGTFADTRTYTRNQVCIGQSFGVFHRPPLPTANQYFNGHIDEFRITKGWARYGASFTAPAQAFDDPPQPYDAFRTLRSALLRLDGDNFSQVFTDVDGTTWTQGGGASLTTANQRYGTASLNLVASSNQYIAGTDQSRFGFGGEDYAVECWVRAATTPAGNRYIVDIRKNAGQGIGLGMNSSRQLFVVDNSSTIITGTGTLTVGTWHHVAATRHLGRLRLFLDGAEQGAVADTRTMDSTCIPFVGSTFLVTAPWDGQIDDLRITKGAARYVGNYNTPATAVLQAPRGAPRVNTQGDRHFASTVALLHFAGANASTSFRDESGKTWTAVGNAQIQTAVSVPQRGALFLDGTGDCITSPSVADFDMGSGNWTMECFIRISPAMGAGTRILFTKQATGATFTPVACTIDNTGVLRIFASNNGSGYQVSLATAAGAIAIGAWAHIAFVREGDNFSIYVNGARSAFTTFSLGAVMTNATAFSIGACANGDNSFHGWIAEARITKGVARYSGTSYVVPTRPLPDATDANYLSTVLHLKADATFKSNVFADSSSFGWAVTTNGNARHTDVASAFGGHAIDVNGGHLTVQNAVEFDLSGAFTIEAWIRPTLLSGLTTDFYVITGKRATASAYTPFGITVRGDGQLIFVSSADGSTWGVNLTSAAGAVTANQWHHVAASRSGNDWSLYINGTRVATAVVVQTPMVNTDPVHIGTIPNGTFGFVGFIDEIRITKGVARYTGASHTVPVRAPSAYGTNDPSYASVSALLHFNGANGGVTFPDSSPTPKTVSRFLNAQLASAQRQFGSASLLLNSAGPDRISLPDSADFDFGSGNWTIEAWLRFAVTGGTTYMAVAAKRASGAVFAPFNCVVRLDGRIAMLCSLAGSAWDVSLETAAPVIASNTWTHVVFERAGSTFAIYSGGTRHLTTSVAGTLMTNTTAVFIGGLGDGALPYGGHIDELRITKGVARYNAATYTVPTAPFADY